MIVSDSHILIVTLGTKPQLVTLPLHLLAQRGIQVSAVWVVHPFFPVESRFGQAVAMVQAMLPQLFPAVTLRLVTLPTADIDSEAGSQALLACLYQTFVEAKRAGCTIHFGIAGGRRTMGLFGMVVAQLLFDEVDRVWHLYSTPDLEESRRLLPQATDECHLVEVPVIRWRSLSPLVSDGFLQAETLTAALSKQRELRLYDQYLLARAFVEEILTAGEARVLAVAQTGVETDAVAARLCVARSTIETHLKHILSKARAHWDEAEMSRSKVIRLVSLYYVMAKNHGFQG